MYGLRQTGFEFGFVASWRCCCLVALRQVSPCQVSLSLYLTVHALCALCVYQLSHILAYLTLILHSYYILKLC
jgi:hypothetical protein